MICLSCWFTVHVSSFCWLKKIIIFDSGVVAVSFINRYFIKFQVL